VTDWWQHRAGDTGANTRHSEQTRSKGSAAPWRMDWPGWSGSVLTDRLNVDRDGPAEAELPASTGEVGDWHKGYRSIVFPCDARYPADF
jgi:hypothetical protein